MRGTRRGPILVGISLIIVAVMAPASATTVTTWDGQKAYTNCGTDVLTVGGPDTQGPCTFSRYDGRLTGGAYTTVDAALGRVGAYAYAYSTMPIGLTYNPVGIQAQPQATARVTKRIAVSAGTVTVNFDNVAFGKSNSYSNPPTFGLLLYPQGTQASYSGAKLEAIYYFHPCAITVNCTPTATRVVTKGISSGGDPHSLVFQGPNAIPGSGWIDIEMGVYAIVQVAGPATATAQIEANVTSLITP